MKHVVLLVVLVTMPVVVRANSTPCFVVAPEFRKAYETARSVFIGEVIRISGPITTDVRAPLSDRLDRVTFKVEYSWKGAGFQEFGLTELVVLTQGRAGVCSSSMAFSEGEKYLVYAEETMDKDLIVSFSSRTTPLANAADDLRELRLINAFFRFATQRSINSFDGEFSW